MEILREKRSLLARPEVDSQTTTTNTKTCLLRGEAAADGARLLLAEVGGLVLAPVVGAESLLLGLVVDGQHASDALAHELDLGELGGGATSDLGHVKLQLRNERACTGRRNTAAQPQKRKKKKTVHEFQLTM